MKPVTNSLGSRNAGLERKGHADRQADVRRLRPLFEPVNPCYVLPCVPVSVRSSSVSEVHVETKPCLSREQDEHERRHPAVSDCYGLKGRRYFDTEIGETTCRGMRARYRRKDHLCIVGTK